MGVLDDMTKGITDRKAAAAGPKLTPVGTEASPTKPSLVPGRDGGEAAFPSDLPGPKGFMSHELMSAQAKDLTDMAGRLRKLADEVDGIVTGINLLVGEPAATAAEAKRLAEQAEKLKQVEADRQAADRAKAEGGDKKAAERVEFAENYARQQAEAQASVFTAADATDEEPEAPATDGWSCPEHGVANLKQLTSRKGRQYLACQEAGCKQFEKE